MLRIHRDFIVSAIRDQARENPGDERMNGRMDGWKDMPRRQHENDSHSAGF